MLLPSSAVSRDGSGMIWAKELLGAATFWKPLKGQLRRSPGQALKGHPEAGDSLGQLWEWVEAEHVEQEEELLH